MLGLLNEENERRARSAYIDARDKAEFPPRTKEEKKLLIKGAVFWVLFFALLAYLVHLG